MRAPCRTVWSMVTTTVAAVLGCRWSVGRCSRSSANASPRRCRQSNDRSGVPWPEPGSRIRRGAVIVSRILARIAAASAGTVKCPVVVPSPLSCSVSEHLSWAACSSERTSSFSWASTIGLVGFDGLDRSASDPAQLVGAEPAGLLHQRRFDDLPLLGAHPVGQLTGGLHDHRRVPGRDQAGVERFGGRIVAGGQLVGQRDLSGRIRAGHSGGLCNPGVVSVNPASFAVPALSAAATILSLSASSRRIARSTSTTSAYSPAHHGCARMHPVQNVVQLGHT